MLFQQTMNYMSVVMAHLKKLNQTWSEIFILKTNKSISWKGILAHVGYEGPVLTLFFRQEPVL